MTSPKTLLRAWNIRVKKRLGQHFLVDPATAEMIVKRAKISSYDIVLEIGPGKGILTNLLADRVKKVIAIEIDRKLVDDLKGRISDNVFLINDDVMNIDFNELPRFNKIVSNIPYQISSAITFKLLKCSSTD